jgi:uncharacterized protein
MNRTKRTELRRLPDRGSHDWETIHQILDSGFLASVGFCVDGQPFVIPTLYGRDGERLYLHGSAASRMLRNLETGIAACVTVTLVDGLVLARSLRVISEHLIAGRWNDVREPSETELKATAVLEFSIEEASSKVRNGPPIDDQRDYELSVWAGVLPLEMTSRSPIPDDKLIKSVAVPDYVHRFDARIKRRTDI